MKLPLSDPSFYRTEHFRGGEKGEKMPRRRGGRGVARKGGQKGKKDA